MSSNRLNFGAINYNLASDRSLAVKITVGNDSGGDMWFAYGTTGQPSSLSFEQGTTTTTAPPSAPTIASTTTAAITTTTALLVTTTAAARITTTTAQVAPTTAPSVSSTTTTFEVIIASRGTTTSTTAVTSMGSVDPGFRPLASTADLRPAVELSGAFSIGLMKALELFMPPAIATAILSPLLIIEFLFLAIVGSFQAVKLPVLLLGLAVPWVATRHWMRRKGSLA